MAGASPVARVVIQQCLNARLMVQLATEQKQAEYVKIGRGAILFVCFLKGAGSDAVEKLVNSVLNVKLSEDYNDPDAKLQSILDLPGDILIIPQATIGGKVKAKRMQYHSLVGKSEGEPLYDEFVKMCREMVQQNAKCQEKGTSVKAGTYGIRQVLNMETNGPYTHIIES